MNLLTFACNSCDAKFQELISPDNPMGSIFCINCGKQDVDQLEHLWERVKCPNGEGNVDINTQCSCDNHS